MAFSQYRDIAFAEAIQIIKSRLDKYHANQISLNGAIPAAVMILMVNMENIPHVLFTRRTELVETHKGQISFPGGAQDPPDKNLLQTAIRETEEEIGIKPDKIEVLGQLDDFLTITDFLIRPFAGILQPPLKFRLSEDEVDEVFQAPLSLFLEESHFEVKKWEHAGRNYDVYFYTYRNHVIWGATAFILNHFIDVVFGYNPAPNPIYRDPRNLGYLRENRHRGSKK